MCHMERGFPLHVAFLSVHSAPENKTAKFGIFNLPKPVMKSFSFTVAILFYTTARLCAQDHDLFNLYGTKLVNDSPFLVSTAMPPEAKKTSSLWQLQQLLQEKESGKMVLHHTKKGNTVELFFFPGTSDKKALVVGGLHGSELPSIEVAYQLIKQLSAGEKPYYNVVVIPSLFPDNAQAAKEDKGDRILHNSGRYTDETTADPNRQMPLPGQAFAPENPVDAMGRAIEAENQALLQLIQTYQPGRFLSVHSIKDRSKAGVFADPRTDCTGQALGFETDEALALLMARQIEASGSACPGNDTEAAPTAIYYLDPPIAQPGFKQVRNYELSNSKGRSRGISMGTWCSTAVCDSETEKSRPAIRTFTMEFPGNLLPLEYKTTEEQQKAAKAIEAYAASVHLYFLQPFFVEDDEPTTNARFAAN